MRGVVGGTLNVARGALPGVPLAVGSMTREGACATSPAPPHSRTFRVPPPSRHSRFWLLHPRLSPVLRSAARGRDRAIPLCPLRFHPQRVPSPRVTNKFAWCADDTASPLCSQSSIGITIGLLLPLAREQPSGVYTLVARPGTRTVPVAPQPAVPSSVLDVYIRHGHRTQRGENPARPWLAEGSLASLFHAV